MPVPLGTLNALPTLAEGNSHSVLYSSILLTLLHEMAPKWLCAGRPSVQLSVCFPLFTTAQLIDVHFMLDSNLMFVTQRMLVPLGWLCALNSSIFLTTQHVLAIG